MKQLLLIILVIYWNSCISQPTPELKELLLKADTISLIHEYLEEEELLYPNELKKRNLSEFCYPEHAHYPLKTSQEIIEFLNGFEYRETEDVMFCGFNYILTGYSNQGKLFTLKINSECNYIWSDIGRYYISEFETNEFLKSLPVEHITTCYFLNSELMNNFLTNQKRNHPDESLEFNKSTEDGEFSVTKVRKITDR